MNRQFQGEAETPAAPTFDEVIRYYINETERRAAESVAGLSNHELNTDPGHGAWSIGQLLNHQLQLLRLITENLKPGSTSDIPKPNIGQEGEWDLDAILAHRAVLSRRLREVFDATPLDEFMKTRPGLRPERWAEWPMLMRILRPLIDIATHVGQVNYARRQLDCPVGSVSPYMR